jgi:tetratricopeptide (TPR) repeat protein
MKQFFKISLLMFIVLSFGNAQGQRVLKKMSKDICKCIENKEKNNEVVTLEGAYTDCIEILLEQYKKDLTDEFGEDLFDESTNKAQQLGAELGKMLAADCQVFIDFIAEKEVEQVESAENYYERGEEEYAEGNYPQAELYYLKALQKAPGNFEYHNSHGIACFSQGKFYRAIGSFFNAIRINPEDHMLYNNLAEAMYQLNDMEASIKELHTAITLNPGYCDSYNKKGLAYHNLGQADSSEYYFRKAVECGKVTNYKFNLAYTLYSQQKYEKALQWFLKAEESGKSDDLIYSYIGNCFDEIDSAGMAVKYHSKHLENGDTTDAVPFYNRGIAYMDIDEKEKAFQDFKIAYSIDSSDTDIIYYLARLNNDFGEKAKTEYYYNELIRLQPQRAGYYDNRAAYYAENEQYQKAIQDYIVSLSIYPTDCNIHEKIIELYEKQGLSDWAEYYRKKMATTSCDETQE